MRNICSLNRTVQSRYAHCINYEMCIFCSYNQLLSENSIAGESQILNVFFTESISRRRKICYNFCIKRHWGIEMIDREEFQTYFTVYFTSRFQTLQSYTSSTKKSACGFKRIFLPNCTVIEM